MKTNEYKEIVATLNKRRRIMKSFIKIKLMTMQEILDLLDYLESLEEPVEYIEETLVKKLNFN